MLFRDTGLFRTTALFRAASLFGLPEGGGGPQEFVFTNTDELPDGVAITRTTIGNDWAITGLLHTSAINAPRFTWNPVSGASQGIYLEPPGPNLVSKSNAMNHVSWQKVSLAVSGSANITGIDGTTSAFTITASAGTAQHYLLSPSFNMANATPHTFLFFIKPTNYQYVGFYPISFGSSTAVVDTVNGTINCMNCTGSARLLANGFIECSVTATSSSVNSAGVAFAFGSNGNALPSLNLAGTETFGITSFQVVQGTKQLTYYPTDTVAATRGEDVCTLTLTNPSSDVTFTFDDNSQQTFTEVASPMVVNASLLNRTIVKKINAAKHVVPD